MSPVREPRNGNRRSVFIPSEEDIQKLMSVAEPDMAQAIRAMAFEGRHQRDCFPDVSASRAFPLLCHRAGVRRFPMHLLRHCYFAFQMAKPR
jgi:hypothetical protein